MAESRRYGPTEPLNLEQILQEAQQRWLRPMEICEILRNHKTFQLASEPPNRPRAGSLFLFDRKILRYFRKDGHRWRKKKDGKTIKEAHEKLKAGSVDVLHCYYAHGEDNENFQRRSYWMLHEQLENIVLVHYREVKEGSKLDVSRLLNVDRGSQSGSVPSLEQTHSPVSTLQTSYASSLNSVDWSEQTPYAYSPNAVDWNEQTLSSAFEDRDPGKDPETSSLALTVCGSLPCNALSLAGNKTGFLELSSDHLDTGFLGASFNCGNGQSIAANIHGSSGNLYHMHDQKFIINQLNAADFLTHKLIDARLDGENTVKDVRCGDMISPDDLRVAQEQDCLLLEPHSQDNSSSPEKLPSTAKGDALVGRANNDEARELKKLDSFGRWMDKEIGGDCDDSLMASNSGNYWNAFDTENEKEVSSASDHMQLNIDSVGPSLSRDQLFSISDFAPDWAYSGVETKVLITGTFLGEKKHSGSLKWCCMFGEIEASAEVLANNVIRCQVPFHAPGRVPLYITCSNRLACSEVREFEYREKPPEASSSVTVKASPEDEVRFQVRLGKMLDVGSERKWLNCSVFRCDKCELKKNITSLKAKSKISSETVENAVMFYEGYCVVNPGDALIEYLVKGKLYEWLICKVHEGGKGPHILDNEGQGLIHLAAGLGFAWAMDPIVAAGVSPNFRDTRGKTALHWAAYYGREEAVIALIRLGASVGAVDDPTSASPGGQTAADLASSRGHKGIAGYLAEADLTSHLSSLTLNENSMESAAASSAAEKALETAAQNVLSPRQTDEEHSLRGSLAAVRKSAHAAALIHAAFRARSFRHRQLTRSNNNISESSVDLVSLGLLNKVRKVSHFEDYLHSAAVKIQQKYRGWKGRKEFLKIRNRIVKIQAHVRGHQVRKQYKKVVWSVSIVEKAILRWRRKGPGLRGFRMQETIGNVQPDSEKNDEYDFLRIGRKQKFAGVEKALARVQSMVRHPEARDQYMRLVTKFEEIQVSDEETTNKCIIAS